MKEIDIKCQISFVKVASYRKTTSEKIKQLIGLNEQITGRNVIIIEDIVDSGKTIEFIYNEIKKFSPLSIKIATLFLKPDIYNKDIKIDYTCFNIPDNFIVGYGLDYDGYGRNLSHVYSEIIDF